MNKYLVMSLLCLCGCTVQAQDKEKEIGKRDSQAVVSLRQEAIVKNNRAVQTVMNSLGNPDSLRYALTLLDEAIALDSTYEQAYANKITYLKQLHRPKEALLVARQMMRMSPGSPYQVLGYALLEESVGDKTVSVKYYNEALQLFDRRLKDNPNDFPLQLNRAFALYFAKGKETALESMQQLIRDSQDDERKYSGLQDLYDMLKSSTREEIVKSISQ